MKKKTMVIMGSLFLAMIVLSFAYEKKETNLKLSAQEVAQEKAIFKLNSALFNDKANQEIRAKRLAETKAAEAKQKADEAQDKGEGQVKVEF